MRIGVDLGGTKIEAIALDEDGTELARRRVAAPRGEYRHTIEAIVALVGEIESVASRASPVDRCARVAGVAGAATSKLSGSPRSTVGSDGGPRTVQAPGPATVGIGIPGAVSPATGLVKNANSTWLIGHPLGRDLEAALGRPVRIENDANCFAVSEAVDGAAAGGDVVFGVILGTGVGGGLVVGGRVIRGRMAIAGEWGHNRLPADDEPLIAASEWPGPRCYCGRRGCIETFLSGPGMLARHHERTGARRFESVESLVAAMRDGDADARGSFELYCSRLARALASVINIVDPDSIVLGGGLSAIGELYERVPRLWAHHIFSDRVDTRLLAPRHGDASGVRGAAWLWPPAGSS